MRIRIWPCCSPPRTGVARCCSERATKTPTSTMRCAISCTLQCVSWASRCKRAWRSSEAPTLFATCAGRCSRRCAPSDASCGCSGRRARRPAGCSRSSSRSSCEPSPAPPFQNQEGEAAEHDARADEELDQHDVVEAVAARRRIVDRAEQPHLFEHRAEACLLDRRVLRQLEQRAGEERRFESFAVDLAVDAAVAIEDRDLKEVVEARCGCLIAEAEIGGERG